MDIQLNFINNSNDANNSQIVIYQQNMAVSDAPPVAWLVVKRCGSGENHPFTFPQQMKVSTGDADGNHTPQLPAQPGELFHAVRNPSGDGLRAVGAGPSATEITVENQQPTDSVSAHIYKDGKLLAIKTSIAPQQKAVFEFKPTIWVGDAPEAVQGKAMNAAQMPLYPTEFSLLGVASADIVMTGGGGGPEATALQFTLENVVYA